MITERATNSACRVLTCAFAVSAVGLRVLLFWANPPINAFDNHFEPILLIMRSGSVPPKDACWECYHPPLFYVISACVGKIAGRAGAQGAALLKTLQFMPCLYSILTLGAVHLILLRFRLSAFSRTLAFGTACFLTRGIYMSALHSNDAASYLWMALCVYFTLGAIDSGFGLRWLAGSSAAITMAVYTKYTAIVVIPAVLITYAAVLMRRATSSRRKVVVSCVLLFVVPTSFLIRSSLYNMKRYGSPLPDGVVMLKARIIQMPGRGEIRYADFKPWHIIRSPILTPENICSFWTILHGSMWFDVEPKFLLLTDADRGWWESYYSHICGGGAEFPDIGRLSSFSYRAGSVLIALGLVPLIFFLIGLADCLLGQRGIFLGKDNREGYKLTMLVSLLGMSLALLVVHTLRYPYFSAMKASYIIGSLPAFVVILARGIMKCENIKAARLALAALFGALFVLVAAHVIHIALCAPGGAARLGW